MIWPGKHNYKTPENLEDAIKNSLWVLTLPSFQMIEKLPAEIRMHVKDFMSQKFSTEMLREGADTEALQRLWNRIFPEGEK